MKKDFNIEKQQVQELLKLHYGFNSFRPGQERAIDNALKGKDTLVIMPTGGGKSLCYQLPALVLEGITLVVSPLIALMKDQVDSLERIGVPATFINSAISSVEARNRLEQAENGEIKILYIAPERFYNQEFIDAVSTMKITLFAVDEAHCISEWGHDFRPSYLKLRTAIQSLGCPPVMALTATATPEVREDIVGQLGLKGHEPIITGFARPNLQFGVIQGNEANKLLMLTESIKSAPSGSGIIYVGTRNKAEEISDFLTSKNITSGVYHAGMNPADRKYVQDQFMHNQIRVIVATNAFGLGIDKKDIRFVVHYDLPGTVEAYYQEAGRAGRDGKPSLCLLFYHPRDRHLREFFIRGDNPPPDMIIELYEVLKSFKSDKIMITYNELKRFLSEDVPEMAVGTSLRILESAGLIGRTRERSGNGFLKFNFQLDLIKDKIKRSKTGLEILEQLDNSYGPELYRGLEFNAEDLSAMLGFKKDAVMRLINKLSNEGGIEYEPPFRGTEITLLKRIDRAEVGLDFGALKKKLRAAYDKLEKMEDYVYNFDCRQRFILDYFGDAASARCGKCDNCLNGFQRRILPREKKERKSGRAGTQGAVGKAVEVDLDQKSGLTTKLTQLSTYELYRQGLALNQIAGVRKLKPETIVDHLCYLIDKGMDIDIGRFIGKDKIARIRKAAKKVGGQKLKPIKDELDDEEVEYGEIKLVMADQKHSDPCPG